LKPRFPLIHIAVVLVGLTSNPAEAQWGMLLDKLQELSGPAMWYTGLSIRTGYQPGQRLVESYRDSATTRLYGSNEDWGPTDSLFLPSLRRLRSCATDAVTEVGRLGLVRNYYDESVIDRLRRDRIRLNRVDRKIYEQAGDDIAALVAEAGQLHCLHVDLLRAAVPDPLSGFVWRFGLFVGRDRNNEGRTEDVYGLALHASLEYRSPMVKSIPFVKSIPLVKWMDVGIEAGFTAHFFHGDITDFWHPTYPLRLNVHPFPRCDGWLLRNLRAGYGVHIVPPFEDDAFAPVSNYAVRGWEFPREWFIAMDVSVSSVPRLAFWRGCFKR